MKIPREILNSMSVDARPTGVSLAVSSLADRRTAASRYLSRTVDMFITDESGRGLTAYGIVIAVVLLACGILCGLFVTKPAIINRFLGCQACGMG